ncbi:MAG: hypothetical protein ACLGHY_10710 [Gammaproteobacteria bacterium]
MPYEALAIDDVRKLDGPPAPGFDCGHPEQNAYFYDRAWNDQLENVAVTYCYYAGGALAGYATVLMDGLSLAFRERGVRIGYETVGATKLAQLGVDLRFQGRGLGDLIVADVVGLASQLSGRLGCRFVTVDARPGLETWYQKRFFKPNQLMQKRRIQFALEKQRDPQLLPISMRLDLWDPRSRSPVGSAETAPLY